MIHAAALLLALISLQAKSDVKLPRLDEFMLYSSNYEENTACIVTPDDLLSPGVGFTPGKCHSVHSRFGSYLTTDLQVWRDLARIDDYIGSTAELLPFLTAVATDRRKALAERNVAEVLFGISAEQTRLARACNPDFRYVQAGAFHRSRGIQFYYAINREYLSVGSTTPAAPDSIRPAGDFAGRLCGFDLSSGEVTRFTDVMSPSVIYGTDEGKVLLLSVGEAFRPYDTDSRKWLEPLPGYKILGQLNKWQSLIYRDSGEIAVFDHRNGEHKTIVATARGVVSASSAERHMLPSGLLVSSKSARMVLIPAASPPEADKENNWLLVLRHDGERFSITAKELRAFPLGVVSLDEPLEVPL